MTRPPGHSTAARPAATPEDGSCITPDLRARLPAEVAATIEDRPADALAAMWLAVERLTTVVTR